MYYPAWDMLCNTFLLFDFFLALKCKIEARNPPTPPPVMDMRNGLIFGYTQSNKPLHIVVGSDENCAKIITAYLPTTEKFEDDLKTRKGALK